MHKSNNFNNENYDDDFKDNPIARFYIDDEYNSQYNPNNQYIPDNQYNPNNQYIPNNQYNPNFNDRNNYQFNNQNNYSIEPRRNSKKRTVLFMMIMILVLSFLSMTTLVVINLLKKYEITFELNGATRIIDAPTNCKSNIFGHCYVTLPSVTRDNGEIIGYSKNASVKEADYRIGQEIELDDDLKLYVISKKNNVLNIDTSEIDDLSVSKDSLTCITYNTEASCSLSVPRFNKRGYVNVGYSEVKGDSKATVHPGDTHESNTTLYPVYKELPRGKLSIKDSFALNNAYVDIENSCNNDIASLFTEYVKTIEKGWPFFFHNQKIVFIGNSSFRSYTSYGNSVYGVTYHDNDISPLVVKCVMPSKNTLDIYMVIVHELAHSFDQQYEYIFKKRISSESDIIGLYNKYKNIQTNRPLSSYAFSGTGTYDAKVEFFAELMAFYYLNYVDTNYQIIQGVNFYRGNFPDDMKKVAEKYICIGMNNFDKSKCT